MDIDIDKYDDVEGNKYQDIVIYFSPEDIRKITTGDRLNGRVVDRNLKDEKWRDEFTDVVIDPEPYDVSGDTGHYNDVLDALEEMYALLNFLYYSNGSKEEAMDKFQIEKMRSTYEFYNQVQQEYS